jgi:nitrite reductase (NADH) large subunit
MGSVWRCDVCGHVHEGESPPAACPVCGAESEMFSRMTLEVSRVERAWHCTVCGYIHQGESPPASCPVCGAASELFELEEGGFEGSVPTALRVLVLGAGIAGTTAVDHARRAAPNAELTLVSAEPGLPYYRLNLTRLLAGELEPEALAMANAEWFASRRVEFVHGTATSLDRAAKRVLLNDGRVLGYDRLVLALGSRAFLPPLSGATLPGVYLLRTLVDTQAIIDQVARARVGVVVGGGLLGLETAAAMARRGVSVTVLEQHPWLLHRQLAERPARLLEAHLGRLGVTVRSAVRTRAIVGQARAERVELESGDVLPADLVVVAAGIRPEVALAQAAGIDTQLGTVVDERMVTSDPSILAAGDVAEHQGQVGGIWPVAYTQGRVAGHNAVVGSDSPLAIRYAPEPPGTRLKVVTTSVASVGEFAPTDPHATLLEAEQNEQYLRLVLRGGWLVGVNLIGDAPLASELEGAIERGASHADLEGLILRYPLLKAALAKIPWSGHG